MEISDSRLVSRVLMYYAKYTEFKNVSELRKLAPDVLQQALNTAIPKRGKVLKAMYDEEGRLQGIASIMHEQVSWAKVREVVEAAIKADKEALTEHLKDILRWERKTLSKSTMEEIAVASQSVREAVGRLQQEVAVGE